jgi:hypothetical protein
MQYVSSDVNKESTSSLQRDSGYLLDSKIHVRMRTCSNTHNVSGAECSCQHKHNTSDSEKKKQNTIM